MPRSIQFALFLGAWSWPGRAAPPGTFAVDDDAWFGCAGSPGAHSAVVTIPGGCRDAEGANVTEMLELLVDKCDPAPSSHGRSSIVCKQLLNGPALLEIKPSGSDSLSTSLSLAASMCPFSSNISVSGAFYSQLECAGGAYTMGGPVIDFTSGVGAFIT